MLTEERHSCPSRTRQSSWSMSEDSSHSQTEGLGQVILGGHHSPHQMNEITSGTAHSLLFTGPKTCTVITVWIMTINHGKSILHHDPGLPHGTNDQESPIEITASNVFPSRQVKGPFSPWSFSSWMGTEGWVKPWLPDSCSTGRYSTRAWGGGVLNESDQSFRAQWTMLKLGRVVPPTIWWRGGGCKVGRPRCQVLLQNTIPLTWKMFGKVSKFLRKARNNEEPPKVP